MWWLLRRCSGSMVAFQTTEPVIPGSNPASMENSEDRQSHCVYSKISGQRGREGDLPLGPKKIEKKKKYLKNLDNFLDSELSPPGSCPPASSAPVAECRGHAPSHRGRCEQGWPAAGRRGQAGPGRGPQSWARAGEVNHSLFDWFFPTSNNFGKIVGPGCKEE